MKEIVFAALSWKRDAEGEWEVPSQEKDTPMLL